MTKTVEIDGKEISMRASAAIPRMYRIKFRRDIMQDMREIDKAMKAAEDGEAIPAQLLESFENMAYLMAKHADPTQVPQNTVEEWLDTFSTFSIYTVFPQIMELWEINMETLETPKKK